MNRTIILLGPTGSGKGTQAHLLVDQGNFHHLNTGDLIRAEIGARTEFGKKITELYGQGKLVPDTLIMPLFRRSLQGLPPGVDVLLDGYPRTLTQAQTLDDSLGSARRKVDLAILLEISTEEALRRLKIRRICPSCQRIFLGAETVCPKDGSLLERRSDDNPEAVAEKLRLFELEIRPVADYYRSQGKLLEVHGERSIEEVSAEIEAGIGAHT